jgi:nitrite reductase/ring-hydroxylating ferredoxin subunit
MRRIEISLDEIPTGRPLRLEHGETGVVVVQTTDGVQAFEDSCPHAQWRLSDGELVGDLLECPGHGWEFVATTGRCVNVPAYCLKRFALIVKDGVVAIDVQSPAEARDERPAYDGQAAL